MLGPPTREDGKAQGYPPVVVAGLGPPACREKRDWSHQVGLEPPAMRERGRARGEVGECALAEIGIDTTCW